jgi:glycosyltransferase involved in cell wall biosynthesis
MKKRILLDALGLAGPRAKGVQRYVLNFLKQYSAIDSNYEFTVLTTVNFDVLNLPKSAQVHYVRINSEHPAIWRLLELPNYIKKNDFQFLHIMNEGSVFNDIPIPYMMTVNESLKKYYRYSAKEIGFLDVKKIGARFVHLGLRRKMLEKACMLTAISGNTKKDLISEYGLSEDKIQVIHWAADEIFFSDNNKGLAEDKNAKSPYILIFATGDRRENVACELKAFARIKNEIKHYLYIVGIPDQRFKNELTRSTQQLGILDRTVFFDFLNRDRLASIYKNADVYVDMSLLEGFGLQVVEAMASETAVICSNVDSLPEVVGDAGLLLEPNDASALADALLDILKDKQKREKMARDCRIQAKEFSWEKTTEQMLQVYEELICPGSL